MKKRILPFLMLMLISAMGFAQDRQIHVTVPDSVQVVYIAGTFNGWNPESDKMLKVTDTTYTYDFQAADTSGIAFKFLAGPAWEYEQVRTADFRYSTDSITRVDEFKAIFDSTALPQEVTIEVLVPVEVYQLFLTGNFVNWVPDSVEMEKIDSTQDGKVFTATIQVADSNVLEFKFVAGPGWSYEQSDPANYVYSVVGGNVVCDAFKKIYDPSNVGEIVLNITVPEGTPEVWIIGDFVGWEAANAVQATKVTDTTYTITISAADISYKVYNHPDWPYEEAINAAGDPVADRTASFIDGPTFDITVAFWKDVFETGVNDHENSKIRVYPTRYQTIVAEGVAEKVTIFDMQGRIVQDARTKGTFISKSLRTGIYIIRVDNHTQKVAIE